MMYKRYYDGYTQHTAESNSGEVIIPRDVGDTYQDINVAEIEETVENQATTKVTSAEQTKITGLKSFGLPGELDDIILIGVLLMLLWNSDNDDPIMLIIIGFIFISEIL